VCSSDLTASADGDTDAVINHNLGISVADLARGFPEVVITGQGAVSALQAWRLTASTTNSITITKSTAGGTGDPLSLSLVTISRPHSIGR
jgi:hypothetical protein